MTRWLEGVAICMQGTQTFWIERQPGPTEHQQKTLGKHSPTPELRANPKQGQAVPQMKSSAVTCVTASIFQDGSRKKRALGGPSSPLTTRAPGTSFPVPAIFCFGFASGLSFWSVGCMMQRECLILLLAPVVCCLVHIWHATNIDGSELKQHG